MLAERQSKWLGTVLLEPRISNTVFTTVAVAAGVTVLALLIFGSYTRRTHISGWLVPEQGLARVFAPQSGVVTRIAVHEGEAVKKGDPLLTVSAEIQTAAHGAAKAQVVHQLANRRDSMASDRHVQEQLFEQQSSDLARRLEALRGEVTHLAAEAEIQRARVSLAEQALARDRLMRARDLISLPRLQRTEQDTLDNKARLEEVERSRSALQRERDQVQETLSELPFRRQTQLAEIDRGVTALDQEVVEAESRREIVIAAPEDGTVAAIQAEPGTTVQSTVPLVSIVPTGSDLQAQLFCPSRAIGFVQVGQRVMLRYNAYPYQKFGFYEGKVVSIAQSSVSPSELPQQLNGLSSLYGSNEPLYRITVALARQTANAYGKPAPLTPGMQLEADVLLETRRLIEWAFDPLFTMTGGWHG